ncbi:hypothetical protein N005_15720 [Pseudomonas mediterranea CFBP 5447]|jgi:hypothetical protein|nr:hypothetical protein N005_15720 [Pseudomonas mediterranea CFBP 5447]
MLHEGLLALHILEAERKFGFFLSVFYIQMSDSGSTQFGALADVLSVAAAGVSESFPGRG